VTVLVRCGPLLVALLAMAGCGGAHTPPQPRSSLLLPAPVHSPTGRPRPAGPGSSCGRVTTITGGHAEVTVVKGRTTCAEAMRVFQKYNDPATPAEGSAGLVVIGHWTCETRRTATTCVSRSATIRSRG
jgi:hypothetical protein